MAVTIASIAMVWWMFYGAWTAAPGDPPAGGFGIAWLLKLAAFILVANLARRAGLALALRILLAHAPTPSARSTAGEAGLAARVKQVLAQLGEGGGKPVSPELQRRIDAVNRDLRAEVLAVGAGLKVSPKKLSAGIRTAVRAIASQSGAQPAAQAAKSGFDPRV
jgi:hypothetical protein